jgi:hypothetical protein
MITQKNRYPGQLMPVGARYWYNAGRPLEAILAASNPTSGLGSPDGLGGPLAVSGVGELSPEQLTATTRVLGALIAAGLGYYVGSNIARPESKRFAGVAGAISAALLGVPGLAITTFLYAPRK